MWMAVTNGFQLGSAMSCGHRICKDGFREVAFRIETGLRSRCDELRWLNQHSLNRDLARIYGLVCSVRQSGMPKEPRLGPAVLGRVHQRLVVRPSGSVFCISFSC